jgi:hypothetical protein
LSEPQNRNRAKIRNDGTVPLSPFAQYPFSDEHKSELDNLAWSLDVKSWMDYVEREDVLTSSIIARIEASSGIRGDKITAAVLPVKVVAEFLTALSGAENAELPRLVRGWLERLGVGSRKRGRPKGRKQETLHLAYFDIVLRAIIEADLFRRRTEFKVKHGRRWQIEFDKSLREEGWPQDFVDLLSTTIRSPRVLAVFVVAKYFEVSDRRISYSATAAKSAK